MTSVTGRIRQVKQPKGGYINPNLFEEKVFCDEFVLHNENISGGIVGSAVDYLTRFMLGEKNAFDIPLKGAEKVFQIKLAEEILSDITGLDDKSIDCACMLAGYDVCYRSGNSGFKNVLLINADADTISNIRVMVNRCINFFNQYGPVVKSGFTFEGGYTALCSKGDGDFLTKDMLIDLKTSKYRINDKNTLQIALYFLLGINSGQEEFKSISKLGIFNPRLNRLYSLDIDQIERDKLIQISKEVIGC